ncbi:histidinol-phosphate aminotransferase family protein, partial [bacterium]|nr:histidinol-phosphate aminotransferase family protein [bacterium]
MKTKPYLKSCIGFSKTYEGHQPVNHSGFLDCSQGANSFGVSEKVLEAATEYDWSQVWLSPDPSCEDLKGKIVEFWSDYVNMQTSEIQIGRGSMEILERVNKLFLDTHSIVLGYSPQFPGYIADIDAWGAKYDAVILKPEENFKFYVERLLDRITRKHSLIYIDNPNNPTGQMIKLSAIEAVVRKAKNMGVAVIVDEAYGEYMEQRNSAVNLINEYDNLIVTRTFDKGFGLCSLKIGYGILPREFSEYFTRVTPPFRAATISSYLAVVALAAQGFVTDSRQSVRVEKEKLIKGLKERGYLISKTYEYCPIFLAGHKNNDIDLRQDLLNKGILTVPVTGF